MDLSAVPSLLVSPSTVRLFKVRFVLVWLASSPEATEQLTVPYRVLPLLNGEVRARRNGYVFCHILQQGEGVTFCDSAAVKAHR